jgi:Tol biopolymer transport system component/DNA-binding CsgD family transcriptional regulator
MGRRGRPPYPDILTPREWDVLGLVREGLSNPEIADRLGIGRETVKHHVSEILGKLGVSSREEAARWRPEEKRPWWSAVLVPLALAGRRMSAILPIKAGWVAAVAAAVLFLVVIGGLALMAFLLLRGGGSEFEVISVNNDGDLGSGNSFRPSISADGRYVAFESYADNLAPGDTQRSWDIFVHDRKTGKTELVNVSVTGTFSNAPARSPAISGDGRYVAFASGATDLVAEEIACCGQVFVRDRLLGRTELVSVSSSGVHGDGLSHSPAISADGRFVAFGSRATNLAEGDEGDWTDIYIHDRELGITALVSVNSAGEKGSGSSPAISADGRFVVFTSGADNLVPGDANDAQDVFIRDLEAGTTERITEAAGGGDADDWSFDPATSADGRFVAFFSLAGNLVPGLIRSGCHLGIKDAPYRSDACPGIYVHDRGTGRTEEISLVSPSTDVWAVWSAPSVSADGRYVAFVPSLVPKPGQTEVDIVVRDREKGTTNRLALLAATDLNGGLGYRTALSADGGSLAVSSYGMRFWPEDAMTWRQIFVMDLPR